MAQDYASSINGVVVRATRLNADGTVMTGEENSYVMKSFISLSFTPEYEDGEELTQKDASGAVCTTFRSPDTLKRVNLELAICEPDPEFTELVSGGTLLTNSSEDETMGWAAPEIGVDALPNGVALEVWSSAIQGGKRAAKNPYWRWVFPFTTLRQSGDRVIENGILANSFEGWGVGNTQFGQGPGGEGAGSPWPYISSRAYQYARFADTPTPQNGYVTVTTPAGA